MDDKQVSPADLENIRGVSSLLGVGEVECDKCGKIIKHLDRYCLNAHECPICEALLDNTADRGSHFGEHPSETPRGTRYCVDCSLKAGYLRMVRNKKTGVVFPSMFVSRDEEAVA